MCRIGEVYLSNHVRHNGTFPFCPVTNSMIPLCTLASKPSICCSKEAQLRLHHILTICALLRLLIQLGHHFGGKEIGRLHLEP